MHLSAAEVEQVDAPENLYEHGLQTPLIGVGYSPEPRQVLVERASRPDEWTSLLARSRAKCWAVAAEASERRATSDAAEEKRRIGR